MTDIITTKVCTKCNEEKTIDCFYRSNQTVDGLSCHCKKCHKADIKAWREQNKTIVAKKSRERYAKKSAAPIRGQSAKGERGWKAIDKRLKLLKRR